MTGPCTLHLSPDDIDAWLAGSLAGPALEHLEQCPTCLRWAEAEQEIAEQLTALPLFSPRTDFADRVMAAVSIPDPFAIRSLQAVRRRLFANRKSVAVAASIALALLGSMGASIVWTLAHREVLFAGGDWLLGQASRWAWLAVRGAALNVIEQPWYATFRALLEAPGRLALLSAVASLVYVSGLLALRRLLALPAPRVAHANW